MKLHEAKQLPHKCPHALNTGLEKLPPVVREAGVSRHHGAQLWITVESPRTSQQYGTEVFKGGFLNPAPIMPRERQEIPKSVNCSSREIGASAIWQGAIWGAVKLPSINWLVYIYF